MHSDERGGANKRSEPRRAQGAGSKREMLRLKTPSVGKLFNYLRYCEAVDDGKFDARR